MKRVVVFTRDVVGERMAGPGIRAWHIAAELARRFPTTLVAQMPDGAPEGTGADLLDKESPAAASELRKAGIVVAQPGREVLALGRTGRRLVFDLFDPLVLELRELYGPAPSWSNRARIAREWGRLRMALRRGDAFVAATAAQRHFYCGVAAASGGDADASRDRWIEMPFGIDPEPPPPADPLDRVPTILWGGGVWEWLDPLTAVEGVRIANERGIPCRLLFLGGRRPNAELTGVVGAAGGLDEAVARSGGSAVRNEEWVPYRERGRWLAGSSVAIMLHKPTAEAEFSIRTRLFDAIWSSLPVIATAGGFAAELVEREGLGIVVPPQDPDAVAAALGRLLGDDVFRASCVSQLGALRPRFAWDVIVRPLVNKIEQWQ